MSMSMNVKNDQSVGATYVASVSTPAVIFFGVTVNAAYRPWSTSHDSSRLPIMHPVKSCGISVADDTGGVCT
jgi:hypothetical protein